MVTQGEIPKIIETVKEQLKKAEHDRGIHLQLSPHDYRIEDDWLYLCVTPSREGVRASDHAELMAEIEKQLREQGNDNVLLVPTLDD